MFFLSPGIQDKSIWDITPVGLYDFSPPFRIAGFFVYPLDMEENFEFNVDPWEVYPFPTEQELLEREEWERKEVERYFRECLERDMEEHQSNYRIVENSIGMKSDERRKLVIHQYLKYKYPRLVQNGIELTQNEVQSILEEHLREDVVILIQRFLLFEYRNDIDDMMGHQLNLEINLLEIPVGETILNYIDGFIRQKLWPYTVLKWSRRDLLIPCSMKNHVVRKGWIVAPLFN